MNLSILQNFSRSDINKEPFPYISIENALPADLYERLSRDYPSIETIFSNHVRKKEQEIRENTRYDIPAIKAYEERSLDIGLWRDFVLYHTSQEFLDELLEKLGEVIAQAHPELIPRLSAKAPEGVPRAGVRGLRDAPSQCEVALDCQVGANSPVISQPSSVRTLHLDNSVELYAGLFYVRDPRDTSSGGNLEIYRWKDPASKRLGPGRSIDPQLAELVDVVPYRANTFALFINSIDSIHGVSVREITPYARRLVNIIAEVYPTVDRVFDERPLMQSSSPLGRLLQSSTAFFSKRASRISERNS